MVLNLDAHKLPATAGWKRFAGTGPAAHFYHATGFSAGVYSPLLSRLGHSFNLSALEFRALWPGIGSPPRRRDFWQLYADDLIAFIEREFDAPIVGMGHSMGATCTVLAAAKRPDLFKSLVLIEPAMVSRAQARLVRLVPKAAMTLIEPARGALKKPDTWASREAFVAHCCQSRSLKRLDDEGLSALAQHGVAQNVAGQFELVYPKVWEADVYTQPPNAMEQIAALRIPCVAIRGKPSVFFTEALWQEWKRRCPATVFRQDLAYGHLLPLEAPAVCSALIESGLAELASNR